MEESFLTSILNKFLYAQPKLRRNIFISRYWYLYSIREIAELYGLSESKVKVLLFRMRNELKKYLEKENIYI